MSAGGQGEEGKRGQGDSRFLMVLCAAEMGAWRKVHGCVELRGGKAIRIDVEDEERAVWLEVIKSVRVALAVKEPEPMQIDSRLARCFDALWAYHHALDTRQNGNIAAFEMVSALEKALGIPWEQGATLTKKEGT